MRKHLFKIWLFILIIEFSTIFLLPAGNVMRIHPRFIPGNYSSYVLLHGDGTDGSTTITNDGTLSSATFTAFGDAQIDTAIKKIGTGSIIFDGTGDYVSTGASSLWDFSGDFTIEMWVYPSGANCNLIKSVSNQDWNSASSNDWNFNFGVTYYPAFYIKGGATLIHNLQLTASTWNHLAVESFNGKMRMYIDGVLSTTGISMPATIGNTQPLEIGRNETNLDGSMNGNLDEIRITPWAVYRHKSFTPQTTAFTK